MEASLSSLSVQSLPLRSLDDQDEDVRIAVRALGAMRNSGTSQSQSQASLTSFQPTPPLSVASSATSTSLPSPTLSAQDDLNSPDFVSRVSHFPLVGTALRAYEQGKASSRVVKYGAEMMESSVKTISRPVIDRLPSQLDEFACRQLDRIGRYRRPSDTEVDRMQTDDRDQSLERSRMDSELSDSWSSDVQTRNTSISSSSGFGKRDLLWSDGGTSDSKYVRPLTPPPSTKAEAPALPTNDTAEPEQEERQVAQRSRWQAVLLEAGGISAALSEESMRRLKYCLQWLQYATAHIDAQILVLRDFTASLQSSTNNPSALISPQHMRTLAAVRRDVVQTIRQVVDVVSKYAGGALPEPARSRVRGFILHLPQRWASAASGEGVAKGAGANGGSTASGVPVGAGARRGRGSRYQHHREKGSERSSQTVSPSSSRPTSPVSSSRRELLGHGHAHPTANKSAVPPTAGAATQAAQRILTLSTESLDMMRGVTAVVKESLDRADTWVERLRIIGLQRQPETQDNHDHGSFRGPPPSSPRLSKLNFSYDFSAPPSAPGTTWPAGTSHPIDAPSPGVSQGFMGMSLASAESAQSAASTPKKGLHSLPEVDDEEERGRGESGGVDKIGEGGGERAASVSKSLVPRPTGDDDRVTDPCVAAARGPEAAKMDVDA